MSEEHLEAPVVLEKDALFPCMHSAVHDDEINSLRHSLETKILSFLSKYKQRKPQSDTALRVLISLTTVLFQSAESMAELLCETAESQNRKACTVSNTCPRIQKWK